MARIYDLRYDTSCGKVYHQHICQHMLDWLPRGKLLLDLGCGTGLFMRRYGELGGTAVGLDISRGMVDTAREQGGWYEYLVGTAEVLPFRDGTFDAVSCMLAFSYLEHPGRMLREAFRVLKPGGGLAVSTLSRSVITSLVPAIYRLSEKMEIGRIGAGDFGEKVLYRGGAGRDLLGCRFRRYKNEAVFLRTPLPKGAHLRYRTEGRALHREKGTRACL